MPGSSKPENLLLPLTGMHDVLEFLPLHFPLKLDKINPHGRIGIVTLWSKIEFVKSRLAEIEANLDPAKSPVAVIGNLYGNGLPEMLRNLLYNPQISDLVICGADRSGSAAELRAFFDEGVEQTQVLGKTVTRIKGTSRIIDDLIKPELFADKPKVTSVGDLRSTESLDKLRRFVLEFKPTATCGGRIDPPPLPPVAITHFPSEPRAHTVIADTPLEAWRELIFQIVRFGRLVHLPKGDRQELQNVRVIIRDPREDDEDELQKYGFTISELRQYQLDMLRPSQQQDQSYTYGHRLRRHFGLDILDAFPRMLKANHETRDCYFSLWDSKHDTTADHAPCLVAVFFRVYEETLTMTATYRAHNALDAWLTNAYGLMSLQSRIARKARLPVGPLSIISHSISVDPLRHDIAQRVANSKGFSVDLDPSGYFVLTVDEETSEIVACHLSQEGVQLHEYRGTKAERIQHEIARDCAISDVNHALYVGRQLAKAEMCLKRGEKYEES